MISPGQQTVLKRLNWHVKQKIERNVLADLNASGYRGLARKSCLSSLNEVDLTADNLCHQRLGYLSLSRGFYLVTSSTITAAVIVKPLAFDDM